MNREELINILEKERIPSCWYSLYGELLSDRIVLYENHDIWEVFYLDERGTKQMLKRCSSESSACDFIQHELAHTMLTSKSVIFSQTPTLLPQTLELVGETNIVEVATLVWLDSVIKQEGALPDDITAIIFEIEKLEHKRYKIHFWGSKQIDVSEGVVKFSVDYLPYHDWMLIQSEKDELGFEEVYSNIISNCKNGKENAFYRKFFMGKICCAGFHGHIHIVP